MAKFIREAVKDQLYREIFDKNPRSAEEFEAATYHGIKFLINLLKGEELTNQQAGEILSEIGWIFNRENLPENQHELYVMAREIKQINLEKEIIKANLSVLGKSGEDLIRNFDNRLVVLHNIMSSKKEEFISLLTGKSN